MIPTFPPRPRRLRSLGLPLLTAGALAAGLGYLVSIWPAPKPFVVPLDREPVAIVPLTSDAIYTGAAPASACLRFLEEWVRHPSWTITLAVGVSGCTGDDHRDRLVVDSSGDASWARAGLAPVPLHLTPTQLATLHAAASLSCARPEGEDVGYSSWFVDVAWGAGESPGIRVRESSAQAQLQAFVDGAVEPYRARRLAERTDFRATVVVEPYTLFAIRHRMTVTFDGSGDLSIRIRGRTISAENLDVDARVDAIDWVEHGGPASMRLPPGLAAAIDRATFEAGMQD